MRVESDAVRADTPKNTLESPGARSYKARILTPDRFLKRVEGLLPSAVRFDAFFMSAHGEPFDRLSTSLVKGAESIGGNLSFGYSTNHQLYLPANPLNIRESRESKAAAQVQLDKVEKNDGLVYSRQSQGARPYFHLRGRAGNIHSKVVQIQTDSETDSEVITFIPEFNLTPAHARSENHAIEFVEKIEDAEREGSISKTVSAYLEKLKSGEPFHDYPVTIGDDLELLVDSGEMGRSLIEERVRELILDPSTKNVLWSTQFAPDGPMLDLIRETARDGMPWVVRLSDKHRNNPLGKLFKARIRDLDTVDVTYCPRTKENPKGFVHSKVLLVNAGFQRKDGALRASPDGKSGVIFDGSHNLKRAGRMLGTGELAIVSRNQALFRDMASFVGEQINRETPVAA